MSSGAGGDRGCPRPIVPAPKALERCDAYARCDSPSESTKTPRKAVTVEIESGVCQVRAHQPSRSYGPLMRAVCCRKARKQGISSPPRSGHMFGRAAGEQKQPLLEDHKGRACCTPKTHAPRHDSLGACDFAGTACTRQSLVFATPFANTNTCNWIYRFPANPGMPRGGVLPPTPVLAPAPLGRVPRCPILRPGDLSVAGNTLIGQFPSPRSGPDARQRSSPTSVSAWTCWHPRPAQVTLATSRCELTVFRGCRPCRGHKATAGIAPRQSPSSRRWGPSMIQGKTRSATFFLQQIIDRKIFPDQGQAATQGVRVCSGVSPSRRQWRTRSYWPR